MTWLSVRLLVGDRYKYLGLIFGVAFACLLMAHQTSVFLGILRRTTSQIWDVHPQGIWVMDASTTYVDELRPLPADASQRVRGVAGVAWAVPLAKTTVRAQSESGHFRQAVLIGLDNSTLLGSPEKVFVGELRELQRPDSVMIDTAGYSYLWPDEPVRVERPLEINDARARLVGVCRASPPFQSLPILYTSLESLTRFTTRDRSFISFVLVGPEAGADEQDVCRRIRDQTGLKALRSSDFIRETIQYYFRFTGIPLNFGITVSLGFIVGMAIVGQTLYLFISDNLRHFALLKAFGLTDRQLIGVVIRQSLLVGVTGYGIGVTLALILLEQLARTSHHLEGFYLTMPVMLGVGAAMLVIIAISVYVSLGRLLHSEPASLFRP